MKRARATTARATATRARDGDEGENSCSPFFK